jgi:hypothetical protein
VPRYRITYTVETPLRATRDITLTHGVYSITLKCSTPIDDQRVFGVTVVEAENYLTANAIAMEDAFGPALDALSLYRKTPAMVQDLVSIVKSGAGATRRAIVIDIQDETLPVQIDEVGVQAAQSYLTRQHPDRPALRWLRYSYRAIPLLERFVFSWFAFENLSGVQVVTKRCPDCNKDLPPFPSMNRDEAFRIMTTREKQLDRPTFDKLFREWWQEFRSAVLHGGRRLDTELRGRMQAAMERFRPAVEDALQAEAGYRFAFPGAKPNDGLSQFRVRFFVEFTVLDAGDEFGDAPPVPTGPLDNLRVPDGVEVLSWEQTNGW